jgi:hypothetical protein
VITNTGNSLVVPVLQRDPPSVGTTVALRGITSRPGQPIGRVDRPVLGPKLLHVVAEPPDRARPPDPLGQHRRRHVRHSVSSARTRGSNTVNDVGPAARSYRGGASEFTALMTVVREIPNRCAIRAFGTPSAASLLISAQSSKVITLQSLSAHFSPPKVFSFRAPPTSATVSILEVHVIGLVRIGPEDWREFREVRLAALSDARAHLVPVTPTGSRL